MWKFYTILDWMNTWGLYFYYLKIFLFGTLKPFYLGQILPGLGFSLVQWQIDPEVLKD